jgi:hypothetical protein
MARDQDDRLDPDNTAPWPPVNGRANWLWLADLPTQGLVLDLSDDAGETATALAPHFDRLVHVTADSARAEYTQQRFSSLECRHTVVIRARHGVLPLRPAAFDCIVVASLPDVIRFARLEPLTLGPWLAGLHPLLRPAGLLCLAWACDRPGRARRFQKGVVSALLAAGFAAPCLYYIEPAPNAPDVIVPQTPRATAAVERARAIRSPRMLVRRLAARAHLHGFLYRAGLLLASR